MNLCVDIGNSNTVIGIFNDGKIIARWRMKTDRLDTQYDLTSRMFPLFQREKIDSKNMSKVIISSVVPMWNHSWKAFVKEFFPEKTKLLFVGPGLKTGIKVNVDNPREVGADRVVNAAAAIELYTEGALIVDSGTAITIDIVTPYKTYIGGAIMPGIMISLEALASRTAALSRIMLNTPEHAVGKNTVESIRSGMYYGFVGMIDRVISESLKELDFTPKIIATGGLAGELTEASEYIDQYEKNLTLRGLNILAQIN